MLCSRVLSLPPSDAVPAEERPLLRSDIGMLISDRSLVSIPRDVFDVERRLPFSLPATPTLGAGGSSSVLLGPTSFPDPPNRAKGFERNGFFSAPGFGMSTDDDDGDDDDNGASVS